MAVCGVFPTVTNPNFTWDPLWIGKRKKLLWNNSMKRTTMKKILFPSSWKKDLWHSLMGYSYIKVRRTIHKNLDMHIHGIWKRKILVGLKMYGCKENFLNFSTLLMLFDLSIDNLSFKTYTYIISSEFFLYFQLNYFSN